GSPPARSSIRRSPPRICWRRCTGSGPASPPRLDVEDPDCGKPTCRPCLPADGEAASRHEAGHMIQVRIHGRGGQGVVTAAELLSVAAFAEGRFAQAFPTFGSERTGAPVVAFCRIDDRPIRLREPIVEPDALIVQDPTLVHQVDLFGGVPDDAFVLVNTTRSFGELGLSD